MSWGVGAWSHGCVAGAGGVDDCDADFEDFDVCAVEGCEVEGVVDVCGVGVAVEACYGCVALACDSLVGVEVVGGVCFGGFSCVEESEGGGCGEREDDCCGCGGEFGE